MSLSDREEGILDAINQDLSVINLTVELLLKGIVELDGESDICVSFKTIRIDEFI